VLTASAATIYGDGADITGKPGGVFTPDDWNTTSTPDHQPYSYSKTIAEKEAWKICGEQNRWDLVTIHPGLVLGPSLTSRTDSTSIDFVMSIMKGQFRAGAPQLWFGTVDVRDVAKLHIEAGFNPSAKGRYIAIEDSYSIPEITGIVKSKVGSEYPVSSRKIPGFLMYMAGPMMGFTMKYVKRNLGYKIRFDNSATIRDFNFKFRPIDETLRDHFEQIKKDGLIK
jgi:nucleoside-diphosphate-sugar epimerase